MSSSVLTALSKNLPKERVRQAIFAQSDVQKDSFKVFAKQIQCLKSNAKLTAIGRCKTIRNKVNPAFFTPNLVRTKLDKDLSTDHRAGVVHTVRCKYSGNGRVEDLKIQFYGNKGRNLDYTESEVARNNPEIIKTVDLELLAQQAKEAINDARKQVHMLKLNAYRQIDPEFSPMLTTMPSTVRGGPVEDVPIQQGTMAAQLEQKYSPTEGYKSDPSRMFFEFLKSRGVARDYDEDDYNMEHDPDYVNVFPEIFEDSFIKDFVGDIEKWEAKQQKAKEDGEEVQYLTFDEALNSKEAEHYMLYEGEVVDPADVIVFNKMIKKEWTNEQFEEYAKKRNVLMVARDHALKKIYDKYADPNFDVSTIKQENESEEAKQFIEELTKAVDEKLGKV